MKTLVIGSSDMDLFVSFPQSDSYVQNENQIIFNLGDKVLTDIIAFVAGGNGTNVSVGLKRLGLDTSFYTFLGTDLLSNQIKKTIEESGVNLIDHPGAGDNTSINVILNFQKDRIIFTHHDIKNHSFDESKAKGFEAFYLTSIGKEWVEAYKQILTFIHENQMAVAFSPGSSQIADLQDIVYEIIAVSEILFVNKEEGEQILTKKGKTAATIQDLLMELSHLGSQMVSITDGKQGAYLYAQGKTYHLGSFNEESLSVNKTGAGDSYASAFFAAYLLGKDVKTCMRWGCVNAAGVMTKIGGQAGLMTEQEIDNALSTRVDFQVEEM